MNMKIVFLGTPKFAVIVLEELIKNKIKPVLIITKPDKPVGRKQILTPPPIKISAENHEIPILQPDEIITVKSEIKELKPDLIIVAAYGKLIPVEILKIPKYGCLNVHPSLLPKYRGASPIQFTILNGDKETGVTIILVSEKLDAGPILASLNVKITNPKITYEELEKELAKWGAELLIKTIPKWINGKIKPEEQKESEATYTKILEKESGRIDWSKFAEEIERQIRALNPWPGTFCKTDNKILKIHKASIFKETENCPDGKIGKTFMGSNEKIAVKCKKDYLLIEELQFEGKRKMTSAEFLRGNINFIGKILE